jgi:hypothetical protein
MAAGHGQGMDFSMSRILGFLTTESKDPVDSGVEKSAGESVGGRAINATDLRKVVFHIDRLSPLGFRNLLP